MKKRVLASFIFLSCFSVLAAACGGKTDTTQNKNTSTVAKPDASKPAPTQTKTTPPKLTAKPAATKPAATKPAITKPAVATHAAAKPCESTVSLVPNGKNTLKKVFHICVAPKSDGGSFDLKVKD